MNLLFSIDTRKWFFPLRISDNVEIHSLELLQSLEPNQSWNKKTFYVIRWSSRLIFKCLSISSELHRNQFKKSDFLKMCLFQMILWDFPETDIQTSFKRDASEGLRAWSSPWIRSSPAERRRTGWWEKPPGPTSRLSTLSGCSPPPQAAWKWRSISQSGPCWRGGDQDPRWTPGRSFW